VGASSSKVIWSQLEDPGPYSSFSL
jgi:hypothetical protein